MLNYNSKFLTLKQCHLISVLVTWTRLRTCCIDLCCCNSFSFWLDFTLNSEHQQPVNRHCHIALSIANLWISKVYYWTWPVRLYISYFNTIVNCYFYNWLNCSVLIFTRIARSKSDATVFNLFFDFRCILVIFSWKQENQKLVEILFFAPFFSTLFVDFRCMLVIFTWKQENTSEKTVC